MYRKQIGCLIGMVILLAWVSVTLAGTVSDEAKRFMTRGMAAVEMAKTPKDYERAVREFEKAAQLAPDWPDVYFNLGSIQAKAGNYGEAMRHYKRYLELAPNAPDAAKVRDEIIKLEYQAEQQEARPKEIKRDGRFIAYDDGTVLDTNTNLMWASQDNGATINWRGAKNYCKNYRGGGYTDWRMPTQDELVELYDAGKSRPVACKNKSYQIHVTELIHLSCCWVWASETLLTDGPYSPYGAFFTFDTGVQTWNPQSDSEGSQALPVRSVK